MTAEFVGLDEWLFDSEIVHVDHREYGRLDLHNDGDLRGIAYVPERQILEIAFTMSGEWGYEGPAIGRTLLLEFGEISNLEFIHEELAHPSEATLIHAWDHLPGTSAGSAKIIFRTGPCTVIFEARSVTLVER